MFSSRLIDNILVLVLSVAFSFISTSGYLVLWGVKPNLILSLIIASIFLRASSFTIVLLVVLSAAALAWTPSLSFSLFVLPLLAAAGLIARRVFSPRLASVFSISFIATFIWYFASDFDFAVNFVPTVFLEGIINGILSVALTATGRTLKVFDYYA